MNNKKNLNQDEPKTREEEWWRLFRHIKKLEETLFSTNKILNDLQDQAPYLKVDEEIRKKKSK